MRIWKSQLDLCKVRIIQYGVEIEFLMNFMTELWCYSTNLFVAYSKYSFHRQYDQYLNYTLISSIMLRELKRKLTLSISSALCAIVECLK